MEGNIKNEINNCIGVIKLTFQKYVLPESASSLPLISKIPGLLSSSHETNEIVFSFFQFSKFSVCIFNGIPLYLADMTPLSIVKEQFTEIHVSEKKYEIYIKFICIWKMNFDRKLCSHGPRNMKVVFVFGVILVQYIILEHVVT